LLSSLLGLSSKRFPFARADGISTGRDKKVKRLTTIAAAFALAAVTFGCGGDSANNTTTTNASNTTVVNSNNTNKNENANANSNANKGATYNANISKEEWEKGKESFGQKAKEAGDKIGQGLEDGWLWVKTRGALLATSGLETTSINVDVNNGMIILRGTVPSQDQIKKADAAAKGVSGSKGVQNQLKVSAAGGNMNGNMGNKNAPAKK
jgi:osmotically-inducible protein OsmY